MIDHGLTSGGLQHRDQGQEESVRSRRNSQQGGWKPREYKAQGRNYFKGREMPLSNTDDESR